MRITLLAVEIGSSAFYFGTSGTSIAQLAADKVIAKKRERFPAIHKNGQNHWMLHNSLAVSEGIKKQQQPYFLEGFLACRMSFGFEGPLLGLFKMYNC